MLSQVSRSFSLVRRVQYIKGFSTSNQSGSGSGYRGASENTTSSTNQTSNAPNYGTSNQTGGGFSGSTNKNLGDASNTTSPASASKATSNSGTSQSPSFGSTANKSTQTPTENVTSSISSFFKSAFGTGTSRQAETNSTLPDSVNAPSIPSNSTTLPPNVNEGVNASPKDRSSTSVDFADTQVATTSAQSEEVGDEEYDEEEAGAYYHDGRKTEFDANFAFADYKRARKVLSLGSVSTRYAFLLWSDYKSAGTLDSLNSDLEAFFNDIDTNPELLVVFDENLLTTEKNRADALDKYLEKDPNIDEKIASFLLTVSEYRRLSSLQNIIKDIELIRNKVEKKMHTAVVASAKPLTNEQRESIKATIDSTFSPDGEVEIEEQIKPEIGGGYEIYYDGEYHLDNTEKTMIGVLESELDSAISGYISKTSGGASGSQSTH